MHVLTMTRPTRGARDKAHRWVTISAACQQLGVSDRTMRRWISAGKIGAELRGEDVAPVWFVDLGDISPEAQDDRVRYEFRSNPKQATKRDRFAEERQKRIAAEAEVERLQREIERWRQMRAEERRMDRLNNDTGVA